jgi:hypothetical protein
MSKNDYILKIVEVDPDFAYQGPRFKSLGENSGELFKEKYLIPWLKNMPEKGIIDFANTIIYMPSFLEEAFGGAVREGFFKQLKNVDFINIEKDYKDDLKKYIRDAKKNGRN